MLVLPAESRHTKLASRLGHGNINDGAFESERLVVPNVTDCTACNGFYVTIANGVERRAQCRFVVWSNVVQTFLDCCCNRPKVDQ